MRLHAFALLAAACVLPALAQDGAGKKPPAPADARSKSELAAEAAKQFTRSDANLDGYLKGDEIVKGWLERYDLDGDGKIARSEFVDVSSRPPKLRHPHPMRDAVARAKLNLASFDKNKDGLIQREEYPGDAAKFREYDRNRDDALSPAENAAMAADEIADVRKKMKSPNRYEFLVLFDVDRSNSVTADEYDGSPADFKKYDKDGDGTVTYDELYPEQMEMRRMAAAGPKPEDLSLLHTMDANKDGKVARDEFKGNDAAWKRLDRNEDGVLTIADAR